MTLSDPPGHCLCTDSDLNQGWNDSFWNGIGLDDLVTEGYSRIGTTVLSPGAPVGRGLEECVACELGLALGTPVGTAVIDAHAGGLGTCSSVGVNVPRPLNVHVKIIWNHNFS